MIFILPVILAVALHYGTVSFQIDAHQNATNLMNALLSTDPDTRALANKRLLDGEAGSYSWLNKLFGASIILGAATLAMLIPVDASPNRAANLISTMAVGFCFAKVVVGFLFIGWGKFGALLAIGVVCALVVVSIRSALIQ